MADLRFNCAQCGQEIECDELWSGREIQCPTCQKELVVPPKPDAPPHAALATAKPVQARLSIGSSQAQRSTAPPPPPPQVVLLQQKLAEAKAGQKSPVMKWVTTAVVVIVLGVGGYLGYPYVQEWLAKRKEAAKQASAPPPVTNTAPVEPPPPPKEKELPVLPAVWTLDVDKASIPEGKANGMIAGTNFFVETARLDQVGPAYLLRLLQGPVLAPDRAFMIYLRPNAGESVTGHTWTVSQDMKGKTVPQVVELWKTNPRYQAKQKAFSYGYAMKLELGEITNGVIPGKIFLAVPPDTEQSVVAGFFKATTSLADAAGVTAANPVVTPNPGVMPNPGVAPPAPPSAERSAFEKRYGTKR
jgi:DNA-directed RNA polymerase subunit RPC12/RpoP